MANTASISFSLANTCKISRNSSAVAPAVVSSGLLITISRLMTDFILVTVSGENGGRTKSWRAEASAAMIPGPPPFVKIASLLPLGNGWFDRKLATSKSSSIVFTRRTPAWRKRTSVLISEVAIDPVCDAAAREPAAVLPPLTTTIGFFAETRRAI